MVKNSPIVTIIMPVYNSYLFIEEAIQSVLNQTYQNWELWIINDNSIDSSIEIINKFKCHKRIYILENKENKGAAYCRNIGIKNCNEHCKYITFLDADDIMETEKIEKQVQFLEKNNAIHLIGCNVYVIDENSKMKGKRFFPLKDEDISANIFKANPFIQSAIMLRKNVFNTIKLYDESFAKCQDYELWFRIIDKYKSANLKGCLLKYRIIDSVKSSHLKKTLFSTIKIQIKWIFNAKYFTIKNVFYLIRLMIGLLIPSKIVLFFFKRSNLKPF